MKKARVVLDSNVIFAGLYSNTGASYQLPMLMSQGRFESCVSVPLILEYEQALLSKEELFEQSRDEICDILDFVCMVSIRQSVFYLWRPFLRDPKDDMVLEVAVASDAEYIVSHNKKHFSDVERFGIRVLTPSEFLRKMRRKS